MPALEYHTHLKLKNYMYDVPITDENHKILNWTKPKTIKMLHKDHRMMYMSMCCYF